MQVRQVPLLLQPLSVSKSRTYCTDLCLCSADCQNEYAESDDEYDEDEVEQEIP